MKRSLLILCCLTLLACVPTPETEYVVNKGDETLTQKLAASPLPVVTASVEMEGQMSESDTMEAAQTAAPRSAFPPRWDEETLLSSGRTLSVHTDLETKSDDVYPVYRTRTVEMDVQTGVEILSALLPPPISVEENTTTKRGWTEQFKQNLAEVEAQQAYIAGGRTETDHDDALWSDEEIDNRCQWYMEQIAAAPDANRREEVSDYTGLTMNSQNVYRLANGERVLTRLHGNGFSLVRGALAESVYLYPEFLYEQSQDPLRAEEFKDYPTWKPVTLAYKDAESVARETLDALGLSDFVPVEAEKANLCDQRNGILGTAFAAGWRFQCRRANGGYPLLPQTWEFDSIFQYGEGDEWAVNKRIEDEVVSLFIDESGVRRFTWSNRKTVVGTENENVALLPFDVVQMRVRNAFSAGIRTFPDTDAPPIEVYRMALVTKTLRIKDSDDCYEMPCWCVCFRMQTGEQREPGSAQSCIYINAVDGSVVHTVMGR